MEKIGLRQLIRFSFVKGARNHSYMSALFIAGTDTGVGKSIVTGLLGRYFVEKGFSAVTQKWIQTGNFSRDFACDINTHLAIMGKKKADFIKYKPYISPYVFKTSSSPHLAASLEGKTISSEKIISSYRLLSKEFDIVLAEGSGGVLVPINQRRTILDIVEELHLPVLVVAANRLGAINHTLLTIEALKARRIDIVGVILNNFKNIDKRITVDNMRIVRKLSHVNILGSLPWDKRYDVLYEKFRPIGDVILKLKDQKSNIKKKRIAS